MKVTPDDYGRRCQFDHFCKLVLYHEAVDYFRERKRQRGWETSFETLPSISNRCGYNRPVKIRLL